jgi:cytoskeletal protein CcmA (bactofilin family)
MGERMKGGSRTIIGPSIVVRGLLRTDEDLVVKGRIDAQITSTKSLQIEPSGIVKANVRVESARISGILIGNVTAGTRIEITAGGRVVGDLLAPRIVISDGAAFKGRIDMQTFDEPRMSASPPFVVEESPPFVEPEPVQENLEDYVAAASATMDGEGEAYAMDAVSPVAPRSKRRRG